jgi:pantetheine-phosphate adenylyltransferase
MNDKRITVYAGSFDPITNGHLDLLDRALKIFDNIIIAVAENPAKQPLFTLEERLDLIRASLKNHQEPNRIKVDSFKGLMNRKLSRTPETLYLMTGARWIYISSRIIKEVVQAGGRVTGLVPEAVEKKLREKFEID